MSYTDDVVRAKLSALNETQESIVTVAQWIMFHRRYADRTASLWLQKLKDSSVSKRLNLVYLANEVVQQSKARKRDDFLIAFSPLIADATASAYKGSTSEVQQKLKRVVEVWRQRAIFDIPIQDAVEARITELDKSRSSGRMPLLGGSTFVNSSGPAAPPEIQPLIPLQQAISKAANNLATSQDITVDYEQLLDSSVKPPSAPVHAARLSALLKKLASAEGAVSESIKARQDLIVGLEKLLETNRSAHEKEQAEKRGLNSMKDAAENKKREVEDDILRKLPTEASPSVEPNENGTTSFANGQREESVEIERPQMEELTPPSNSHTPLYPSNDYEPTEDSGFGSTGGFHTGTPPPPGPIDFGGPDDFQPQESNEPSTKKRKLDSGYGGFGGFADDDDNDDLQNDVDELIRTESGKA